MTRLDDETLGEYLKRIDDIRKNTVPHPDEDKYVLSPENIQVNRDLADALVARDQDRIDELRRKFVLPLKALKGYGREYVIRHGLPTITAEIANDTDWLE
jgi:hypothetical protein